MIVNFFKVYFLYNYVLYVFILLGVLNVIKRSYVLLEKIFILFVYKVVEINGCEFFEMVFNMLVGRVVFNYYRKSFILFGDVVRVNGYIILGDFFEDVNER